nr:MAG TPA_asm: hypothetical protein [Caudoviricetes sp.]
MARSSGREEEIICTSKEARIKGHLTIGQIKRLCIKVLK